MDSQTWASYTEFNRSQWLPQREKMPMQNTACFEFEWNFSVVIENIQSC